MIVFFQVLHNPARTGVALRIVMILFQIQPIKKIVIQVRRVVGEAARKVIRTTPTTAWKVVADGGVFAIVGVV